MWNIRELDPKNEVQAQAPGPARVILIEKNLGRRSSLEIWSFLVWLFQQPRNIWVLWFSSLSCGICFGDDDLVPFRSSFNSLHLFNFFECDSVRDFDLCIF
ncbi:hypothetical protein NE237_004250 [Protea cynaroides]|uniref:Uncharacterized protein n=1 Tax=Protea cynaroides TaxID=273540 RepID=A0A9Q0KJ29_9MAGN|nr:hypothetical protein NE237_004250 [Protea cynaroides]